MPYYRMAVSVWHDSLAPRDACMINPCFHDMGITSDPTGLCTDLAEAIQTYTGVGTSNQITVKAYDLQGTKPVYPAGEHTINAGAVADSNTPRDIAVCLSFYAGQNQKRKRGRLYIPFHWLGQTSTALSKSVGGSTRSKVAALVSTFAGLGGADVDWIVWSQKDATGRAVSNYWVDDEWDTVRSRGLRSTTRTSGTTSP